MTEIKIAGLLIVMLGIATSVFLLQNQQIIRTQAWDCQNYVFNVSQEGVVTAYNGSIQDEPAQQANVFVNSVLITTFDVPALATLDSSTLGSIDVPTSGQFTWRVDGTMDCSNTGSYGVGISPTPTPPQCSYCETMYGRVYTCQFPDPEYGTVSYGRCNSDKRIVECEGGYYCCHFYWYGDLTYCGGPSVTPTVVPTVSPTPTPYITILTDVFDDGMVGKGYTGFFYTEARNYSVDPTLTISASGLPPGLTASTDRCLIEYPQNPSNLIVKAISCPLDGVPTAEGDYMVLVSVSDNFGLSESKSIPLKVIKSAPPGGCLPGLLPGDANGDCVVDGKDYGIWFINYNQIVTGGAADGDFDLSGFVGGQDYGIWFINFGTSITPP